MMMMMMTLMHETFALNQYVLSFSSLAVVSLIPLTLKALSAFPAFPLMLPLLLMLVFMR